MEKNRLNPLTRYNKYKHDPHSTCSFTAIQPYPRAGIQSYCIVTTPHEWLTVTRALLLTSILPSINVHSSRSILSTPYFILRSFYSRRFLHSAHRNDDYLSKAKDAPLGGVFQGSCFLNYTDRRNFGRCIRAKHALIADSLTRLIAIFLMRAWPQPSRRCANRSYGSP